MWLYLIKNYTETKKVNSKCLAANPKILVLHRSRKVQVLKKLTNQNQWRIGIDDKLVDDNIKIAN